MTANANLLRSFASANAQIELKIGNKRWKFLPVWLEGKKAGRLRYFSTFITKNFTLLKLLVVLKQRWKKKKLKIRVVMQRYKWRRKKERFLKREWMEWMKHKLWKINLISISSFYYSFLSLHILIWLNWLLFQVFTNCYPLFFHFTKNFEK